MIRRSWRRGAAALSVGAFWLGPAHAEDLGARFVTQLFLDACVPNLGHPDKVEAWAEARQLPVIDAPEALDLFLGKGGHGTAWAVPAPIDSFALSVRRDGAACAAWARRADAAEVEAHFKALIEDVKRPGIEVKPLDEAAAATVARHRLAYQVSGGAGQGAWVFTLLTELDEAAPAHVSLQVAHAASR